MIAQTTALRPIIITTGTWSTNIGNAFFQLGAHYIVSQAACNRPTFLLTDQAGYWQYGRKREPGHSAHLLDHVDAEYVVLCGSLLTYSFPGLWRRSFQIMKERRTRIVLLGVGQFDYSERETSLCRQFLQKYRPHVLVSRDSATYENFRDLAEHAYDGIDNAYFLPLAYPAIQLDYPPFIVLNFDKGPEPICILKETESETVWGRPGYNACCVPFDSGFLDIHFSRPKRWTSDLFGKYYGYVAGLTGLKKAKQERVGRYVLLRTDHQTNPLCHRKLYYGPGAFAMDVPYGYFALYGNARLTLSDRIHACVVTMAYGGAAMLFSKSPRAQIIERVGATTVFQRPTTLDLNMLHEMRNREITFVKSVLG
ncbi:MAG TPA: hypothetical protein P5242_07635 [Sedimentisphaerales bacterium]|nr:hypothetical protein [Sedimentisphaerales bacterium]